MNSIAKIFFTILMAVMTAAPAVRAQEMTVKSMKMEPMDLSASKYSRSDLNGKACALVKVQIPLEGMVFEGNVMGDVENKAGEYWVYLTAGTKFFKIKHRSVSPLFVTFADYGLEPLSARTTYVLQLAAPASAVAQPMEEVTFRVTPANAVLIVDDVERELTNGTLKLQLSCGTHHCTVSYPGYHGQGDVFEVTAGAVNKRIYELDPKSGTASVTGPAATVIDVSAIKAEADKAYDGGNFKAALELYMKISDKPEAQFRIGEIYCDGKGVKKNYGKAKEWYTKAAEQGNTEAQLMLGWMYVNGKGVKKDEVEATRWRKKAAEQGNAHAQFLTGLNYKEGYGVKKDISETLRWWHMAAEQGHTEAQEWLGDLYSSGDGVPRDEVEAERWYRMAAEQYRVEAEQGDIGSQIGLGMCYYFGKGVNEDLAKAAKWYLKAAEQGNEFAQYKIGVMYYEGKGVNQDYTEAYHWLKKAADGGYKDAKKFISKHKF